MTDYVIHKISTQDGLKDLAVQLAECSQIAIDCEGNGMHAYAAELCVLQISWVNGNGRQVAIIDSIAAPITPLAEVLGSTGPVKLLHDLTFDARLLTDSHVTLGNAKDTAVAAQMTGEPAQGLASLCKKHLGVELKKAWQDHDWAARPLTSEQVNYLCLDVVYLNDLHQALTTEVDRIGVAPEVKVATAHKIASALAPPKATKPAHLRLKSYPRMRTSHQAVAYALTVARDELAKIANVPPFRIAPNGLLEAITRKSSADVDVIAGVCGRRSARKYARQWSKAIKFGLELKKPPPLAPPPDDGVAAADRSRHKKLCQRLQSWRKQQAKSREVDLQVIIPGHAVNAVARALLLGDPSEVDDSLATISGLGTCRTDRYRDDWLAIASALAG